VAGAHPADACYRGDPPGIRLDWNVKIIVPGTMVFTIYEREETGRMMENVLPVPTSLVTATRPCIASTALRTIARPRLRQDRYFSQRSCVSGMGTVRNS